MKHARVILRHLRGALLLASLLLMLAAAFGWIRSRFAGDQITRAITWGYMPEMVMDDLITFAHGNGDFTVYHVRLLPDDRDPAAAARPGVVRSVGMTCAPVPINAPSAAMGTKTPRSSPPSHE